jgi:hypothetical protein
MEKVRNLKKLQTQYKKACEDFTLLNNEIKLKQKTLNNILKYRDNLKEQIDRFDDKKEIQVSEHAILRYLERVKGMDITELQKEILTESVLKMIDVLGGNGTYPADGFSVVIRDNTVVTIKN